MVSELGFDDGGLGFESIHMVGVLPVLIMKREHFCELPEHLKRQRKHERVREKDATEVRCRELSRSK